MGYKMYFCLKNFVFLYVDKKERKYFENLWYCVIFFFFIGVENVNNNVGEGDDVFEGEMNLMNGFYYYIYNEYEFILSRVFYDFSFLDGVDS